MLRYDVVNEMDMANGCDVFKSYLGNIPSRFDTISRLPPAELAA